MESVAHGIGVKNRYALFYDEDLDPLEILRQQEEEKLKRKTEKTTCKDKPSKASKTSKVPATTPTQKKADVSVKALDNTESTQKPKGKPPTDRYQRSYGNNQDSKDFEDRKNIRNNSDQFFSSEQRDRDSEFRRGGRGGFRGGRGGRGGERGGRGSYGGGGGNPENRTRRFDRHSGSDKTGVRPTDKREGAGSNNWGDIRSDINQRKEDTLWEDEFDTSAGDKGRESTNWADDLLAENKDDGAKPDFDNAESKENEPLPEEPLEEAVKEMTLDEWKREQEAKKVVPKYNLRKPGEGEDDKQWKKGYVLKKKVKEENDDDDSEEDDEEDNRKSNQRLLLDIQINFSDSRRGMRGRGRGGRGGPPRAPGRGGDRDRERDPIREDRPPRGGGRGGGPREPSKAKGQQSAPRVDDFNDFPSLVN